MDKLQDNLTQVCRSFLLLGGNVHCPRHMLPPGESRWVCQWDRKADGRQTIYSILSARRRQHKKQTAEHIDSTSGHILLKLCRQEVIHVFTLLLHLVTHLVHGCSETGHSARDILLLFCDGWLERWMIRTLPGVRTGYAAVHSRSQSLQRTRWT